MDRAAAGRLLSTAARRWVELDAESSDRLRRQMLPDLPDLTAVPVIARQTRELWDGHWAAMTAALVAAEHPGPVEIAAITGPFARDCADWDVSVGTILRTYQRGDSILRKQGILERTPFRKPREIQWPRAPYETTQRARVLEAADVGSDVRTYVLAAVDGQLPSMAHQLRADIRDFDLHVCARDADSVPFGPVLGELPFADRVHVHLDTAAGRSSLSAADVLGRWDGSAALYLCGPVGFMDWVATQAVGLGWPGGVIHRESFTAPIYDIRDNAPFEVVLARSGTTLAVPADRQILDVLIEHEVPIRWGCSQGVCGTCVTTVLDGEPEHRDAVLSPAARAANTAMCVCVSRANCPRIVLDL